MSPSLTEPGPTGFDREVRAAIYRRLVDTGSAPNVSDLAAGLAASPPAVVAALERLEQDHALVLQPDRRSIWMAMPFSAVATDVSLSSGGARYFANCAWDGFGIPAVIGQTATVHASCPQTGRALEFQVDREGGVTGTTAVAHFLVPRRRWWVDIGFT